MGRSCPEPLISCAASGSSVAPSTRRTWGTSSPLSTFVMPSNLDLVVLMVANVPWQKEGTRQITPASDRLAMVEAAVSDVSGLSPGRQEIDLGGHSFTADTLEVLALEHPDAELFTIIGDDAAAGLRTWTRWDEVVAAFAPGGGRPARRSSGAGRRHRLDSGRGATPRGVEHRPARPVHRRSPTRLPDHATGPRCDPPPGPVRGVGMTAIAQRRARRTITAATAALGLVIVAAVLRHRGRRHVVELSGG